jgi:sarcosine oxidase
LNLARQSGARLQSPEVLESFSETAGTVTVKTDRGEYQTRHLVLACGAWLPGLLEPAPAGWLRVTRQVQFWFALDAPLAAFEPGQFPIFIWELQGEEQPVYGFPAIDGPAGGIKIASEQNRVTCDPGSMQREVSEAETREMVEKYVAPYFNGVGSRCVKSATCLYTMTPDSHFVIDRHPRWPGVIVASPCSGHGFKHFAALGECLAELVLEGRSRIDLAAFSLSRFLQQRF